MFTQNRNCIELVNSIWLNFMIAYAMFDNYFIWRSYFGYDEHHSQQQKCSLFCFFEIDDELMNAWHISFESYNRFETKTILSPIFFFVRSVVLSTIFLIILIGYFTLRTYRYKHWHYKPMKRKNDFSCFYALYSKIKYEKFNKGFAALRH